MSTINLCLASRLFHPIYSGGALRFKRYLPGLRTRGIQVSVFTSTPTSARLKAFGDLNHWQDATAGSVLPITMVENTPVYRLRHSETGLRRRDLEYGQALVNFCHQPTSRPDLVQFLPMQIWYTPALIRLKLMRLPVMSVYNLLYKQASSPFKRQLQKFSRQLSLRFIDCVIVNSSLMRDKLQQYGIRTRIEVIPNGVDTTHFYPISDTDAQARLRQKLGIPVQASVLVNVGAVMPRKGTDLLLAAWAQLARNCPDCHLIIVGPRTDARNPELATFHQSIQKHLTASGASDRVHFTGQVPNVADYLRAADLFVFSSVREGLPNVVLEAMATALPVVMTPFAGLSDELGQANRHYQLVERTPQSLAKTIHQLLNDQESRWKLGMSSYQWVKAKMNIDSTLDQLANLYTDVARTHHSYVHGTSIESKTL